VDLKAHIQTLQALSLDNPFQHRKGRLATEPNLHNESIRAMQAETDARNSGNIRGRNYSLWSTPSGRALVACAVWPETLQHNSSSSCGTGRTRPSQRTVRPTFSFGLVRPWRLAFCVLPASACTWTLPSAARPNKNWSGRSAEESRGSNQIAALGAVFA